MSILQGSSYKLPIKIVAKNGFLITDKIVKKGVFQFGNIEKFYGEGGEVQYNKEKGCWILPLTESETANLKNTVEWQARFLLNNGEIVGTKPTEEFVYKSINLTDLNGGN